MLKRSLSVFNLFWCAVVLFFGVSVAHAFFPEMEDLALQQAAKNGRLSTCLTTVSFPQYPGVIVNTWQKGGLWNQEWVKQNPGSAKAVAAAALGNETLLAGSWPGQYEWPLPPLALWYIQDLQQTMTALGIDSMVQEYAFVQGRPCLVLGAVKGPRIWLDKKHVTPLRIQYVIRDRLAVQDFSKHVMKKGFWVPTECMVTCQEEMLTMKIHWKVLDSPNPESVFVRDSFVARFAVASDPESVPAPLQFLEQAFPAATSQ